MQTSKHSVPRNTLASRHRSARRYAPPPTMNVNQLMAQLERCAGIRDLPMNTILRMNIFKLSLEPHVLNELLDRVKKNKLITTYEARYLQFVKDGAENDTLCHRMAQFWKTFLLVRPDMDIGKLRVLPDDIRMPPPLGLPHYKPFDGSSGLTPTNKRALNVVSRSITTLPGLKINIPTARQVAYKKPRIRA
jgi:hypothetical protein